MNAPVRVSTERLNELLAPLAGENCDFEPQPTWVRQPLHTVYVPADRAEPGMIDAWRAAALASVEPAGDLESLAVLIGADPELAPELASRVRTKLTRQPIEDLRLDFEDGYGYRGDAQEDAAASAAGALAAGLIARPDGPERVGLRIKPLDTRGATRGIRTLELFLDAYLAGISGSAADAATPGRTGLPRALGALRITLAKVMNGAQVTAFDGICAALEAGHALPQGSLGVELQIEVPHVVAPRRPDDALVALAALPRVRALHFGTYDYTSAQGVLPGEQRSTHPVALHAKREMQAAAAVHGTEVCDGSSNVLPLGEHAARVDAWTRHAGQVRSALCEGYPQGWDLHPSQLPTRYLASYEVLRAEFPSALRRVRAAQSPGSGGAILDEPATLRMLGGLLARALRTGAVEPGELGSGLDLAVLERLAVTGVAPAAA